MKIADLSLNRPITVFMVTIGVAMFGLVALSRLGVDLLPDISYPSVTVRTELPDGAPSDVEQFVTRPIEEAVGVVPNLVRLHSTSRSGQSEVTLEFTTGTRMDLASLSVREKLDLVDLPREAKRPAILRFDPSLDPILRYRLAGGGNLKRLRRIAEQTVKRDLEGAPGVAAVKIVGGEEEEIQVDVDAGRLSQVGLTLADVTRRLAEENVNLAGGSLTEGRSEYLVRATNQFDDPADIRNVILVHRAEGDIRVADVARVRRGAADKDVIARVGGDESVEIAVYKEGDANTVAVARSVKSRMSRLSLPAGMKIVKVADQSRFIENSIADVIGSGLLGGLLAMLVLYAFLKDLKTTLIIGITIPVSVMATFIVMYRMGLSLNLMSLGGLALSIGNLVDNSIVVLENIFKKKEQGLPTRTAASRGTQEVAMAVTASTFTTVAVFLPLVFVEGLAGQLLRDQALTISFSQVISLIVALTLVPTLYALAARERKAPAPREKRIGRVSTASRWAVFVILFVPRVIVWGIQWLGRVLEPLVHKLLVPFDRTFSTLQNFYPRMLRRTLDRPAPVLGFAAFALCLSLFAGAFLPRDLFPSFTQGEFHFNVELPEGTALHVTDAALNHLSDVVKDDPRVKFVHTSAGQTNLSAFAGAAREPNRGRLAVLMETTRDRRAEDQVAAKIRGAMDDIPGLSYEFDRPALLTFKSPVEAEVYAWDLDTLRAVSTRVSDMLAGLPGFLDVESSARPGDPEVRISFDRDRLARVNLDPLAASRQVRNAVQGEAATQFSDLERKLDVRVRASEDERSILSELTQLEVGRNGGLPVSLASVAAVEVARGPGEIRRIGQERAALVTANLKGRDLASASADIEASLRGLDLPEGVRVVLAGQNRELSDSFTSLRFAILLAIFLVYLVMASQFESLLHPFVVMFSMPLGVIGVVVALFATGSSVSVMVLIGLVILAGIVVNNAIVLIDAANQLRSEGRSKRDALIEAGSLRLRPILMTTLTTVLGLLPMAIPFGEGAELRAPLAMTLMGGLTGGTLLTLIVIPVVYSVLDRSK